MGSDQGSSRLDTLEIRSLIYQEIGHQRAESYAFLCNDFNLLCFYESYQDKSADVRKAAEGCISEILRVSGQETIEKHIKDIQGPALALVLEKVRPGFVQEPFESSKAMTGPVSKGVSKISKSTSNGTWKQGNRSRALPTKGSSQITSVHDIAIQSQALLNTKDSNKEDRERVVIASEGLKRETQGF